MYAHRMFGPFLHENIALFHAPYREITRDFFYSKIAEEIGNLSRYTRLTSSWMWNRDFQTIKNFSYLIKTNRPIFPYIVY